MNLGRLGIWTYQLNYQPTTKVREVVAELEELGYGTLWIGEAAYREPLTHAGLLLSSTERMVIATGIANIWARDPFTMTAAQLTLAEAHPDRFLLGLGVSHARLVEGVRGHEYRQPLAKMRTYLDAMDEAATAYRAVKPATPPRVLAALGPRMLELSAERADGAHTYLVTPEHTAKARAQLGPAPWLIVEQAVGPGDGCSQGARHWPPPRLSLSRPAELHQQLPPPWLHQGGHHEPRQRPPGRRPRRMGRPRRRRQTDR